MLTQEDLEQSAEYIMLRLPEVIGNLIERKMEQVELRNKFYKDHPEFKNKKNVVASVIEEIDGRDPLRKLEDIYKEAIPEIEKRIKKTCGLNTTEITKRPDLSSHGEI